MKNTQILNYVNALLGKHKVQLEQQTLENGTVIEADSFAVGQPVFIVTADQTLPLPIGSYTMMDGSILEVTEEGVIGEIATPTTETTEGEGTTEMADETVETTPVAEEIAPDVKAVVDAVVEAIAPVLEEVQTQLSAMKQELASCVKKTEMSAVKPIKHNPERATVTERDFKFGQGSQKTQLNRIFEKLNK
jgi:hypothetical protein